MRIINYRSETKTANLAAITNESKIYPLPYETFQDLLQACEEEQKSCLTIVQEHIEAGEPIPQSIEELELNLPVNAYEVWASGVTYLRSKDARNYESKGKESQEDQEL